MDPADAVLEHFGVKGMKWGVRKEDGGGALRLAGSDLAVDSSLPASVKRDGTAVAKLMSERYGFKIDSIQPIPTNHPEYGTGTIGFVERKVDGGPQGNDIFVDKRNLEKVLTNGEKVGWFAQDCGNTKAFLTHESSHALFHAQEKQVHSFWTGTKVVGGHVEARDKALNVFVKQSLKSGVQMHDLARSVSGYAASANCREELEAEMFSQYHWGKPSPAIKAWGETLHKEMGVDPTPFKEVIKK